MMAFLQLYSPDFGARCCRTGRCLSLAKHFTFGGRDDGGQIALLHGSDLIRQNHLKLHSLHHVRVCMRNTLNLCLCVRTVDVGFKLFSFRRTYFLEFTSHLHLGSSVRTNKNM